MAHKQKISEFTYVVGITLVFSCICPVMAAGSDCASRLSVDSSVSSIIQCLQEQEAELERLANREVNVDAVARALAENHADEVRGERGEPGKDGSAASIPVGTVAAFDRDYKLQSACPPGWSFYEPAGGRMIVGAGEHDNKWFSENEGKAQSIPVYQGYSQEIYTGRAETKDSRATGGEVKHKLTVAEMPTHFHIEVLGAGAPGNGTGVGIAAQGVQNVPAFQTQPAGSGDPHNNMPPFIALYFCKKEE